MKDFPMASWGKPRKCKASSKDRCFNCNKLGHIKQNRKMPNKNTKPEKSTRELIRHQLRHQVYIAVANKFDFEPKLFHPGVANMVKESQPMQSPRSVLYLNLYASHHFTNNKDLFVLELCSKCLDFTTVNARFCKQKASE